MSEVVFFDRDEFNAVCTETKLGRPLVAKPFNPGNFREHDGKSIDTLLEYWSLDKVNNLQKSHDEFKREVIGLLEIVTDIMDGEEYLHLTARIDKLLQEHEPKGK